MQLKKFLKISLIFGAITSSSLIQAGAIVGGGSAGGSTGGRSGFGAGVPTIDTRDQNSEAIPTSNRSGTIVGGGGAGGSTGGRSGEGAGVPVVDTDKALIQQKKKKKSRKDASQ